MSYPLRYVCKWCGREVSTHPDVRSPTPATLTVCDRRDCREAAALAYRDRP